MDLSDAEARRITEFLEVETPPEHADAAFVFGCRFLGLAEVAAELFHGGKVPLILVSGAMNRMTGIQEAALYEEVLLKSGVPGNCILTEMEATNTGENAEFGLPVLERHLGWDNIHSIVAVARWYHARRSLMTLKRHLSKPVRLYSVAFEPPDMPRIGWQHDAHAREIILSEHEKIPLYRERGYLRDITRVDDHFA